jgi:hypothetical protein
MISSLKSYLEKTGKDMVVCGIDTLKVENGNNELDPTIEMVREPSADQQIRK